MTLIEQVADQSFELTTEQGNLISVHFFGWGRVNVLVGKRLGNGRNFDDLAEAVEAYKKADVKAALRALICELI